MTDNIENIYDDILIQLRGEFVDEAEDNLNAIDIKLENLRSESIDSSEALIQIRRVAHSLKGSSSVADFPLVTIVMHKMEDYLSSLKALKSEYINDIQTFSDKAREFSSIDFDQKSVSSSQLSRSLPAKKIEGANADDTPDLVHNLEALLVVREKMPSMLFERELRLDGFRVTTANNSFNAIEMTVRTRPDILIVSGVIDDLSGVDILLAIKSMPTTKEIPVALLTSFERDHHELSDLPDNADIIRKNHFKEDLFAMLKRDGLL